MSLVYDAAQELYEKYPTTSGRTFEQDLAHFAAHGYVYASPECLILASPDMAEDTWHVYLAVGWGCMGKFFSICPFPLKFVQFDRPGRGRHGKKYEFELMNRMIIRL